MTTREEPRSMSKDPFVDVVMGAFLADGLQKISDAIETYRMDIDELIRELPEPDEEKQQ
jgi:hypothetical protein